MDEKTSRKIGRKVGVAFASFGLIISLILLILLDSNLSLFRALTKSPLYIVLLLLGIALLYFLSIFFGAQMGVQILVKKKKPILVGIVTALLLLFIVSFLVSLFGFLTEGVSQISAVDNQVNNYIFKPMTYLFFGGLLPALFSGVAAALMIKAIGERQN